jgi:hypothetical protein
VLVGRSPRLYARGTLETLENKRAMPPPPPPETVRPNAVAREKAGPPNHSREASAYAGAGKPWGRHAQPPFIKGPVAQRRPPELARSAENRSTAPIGWAEETGQIRAGAGPFLERRMREREARVVRVQLPTRGDKAVRAQSIRGRMELDGLYVPTQANGIQLS